MLFCVSVGLSVCFYMCAYAYEYGVRLVCCLSVCLSVSLSVCLSVRHLCRSPLSLLCFSLPRPLNRSNKLQPLVAAAEEKGQKRVQEFREKRKAKNDGKA